MQSFINTKMIDIIKYFHIDHIQLCKNKFITNSTILGESADIKYLRSKVDNDFTIIYKGEKNKNFT